MRRRTLFKSPSTSPARGRTFRARRAPRARGLRGHGLAYREPETGIRPATEEDVPLLLSFIRELAGYERLSHEVSATEDLLRFHLFGERRTAEAVIGHHGDEPAGFALFFHSFSTFLDRPGIYLEDLYVRPKFRGEGVERAMLAHVAGLAKERDCGRREWSVLDWNEPAIRLYRSVGAVPMDEWTVYRVTGEALEELAADD